MKRLCIATLWFCAVTGALAHAEGAGVVLMQGERQSEALTSLTGSEHKLERDGASSFAVEWQHGHDTRWQVSAHRAEAEYRVPSNLPTLQVEHLLIGGYKRFAGESVRPYFGASMGGVRFTPDFSGGKDTNRFAFSLFGGADVPLFGPLNLRLEARWLGALFREKTSLQCAESGCELRFDAGFWSQAEVNAGISLQF